MLQYIQKNALGVGDFCINQKIKSTAYTSFSVLGLSITIIIGGLIIVVSNFIDPLWTFLDRRKRYTYQRLEWSLNETLQLQRMAHEELGLGTWSRTASRVPVTENNEKLGVLDISDPEHPILVRSPSGHSSEKLNSRSPKMDGAPSSQSICNGSSNESSEKANNDLSSDTGILLSESANIEERPPPTSGEGQPTQLLPVLHPASVANVEQSVHNELTSPPTHVALDAENGPHKSSKAAAPSSCPQHTERLSCPSKAPLPAGAPVRDHEG